MSTQESALSVDTTFSSDNEVFTSVAPERVQLLRDLLREVLRVNQQFNLTSVREPQEAWTKHIIDSLQGLQSGCFEGAKSVIDMGAGAGFPGLALAAARPELRVMLLDSTRKKTDFIAAASDKLQLNAQVLCDRAEEVGQLFEWRETFDVATARAVGSLSEVCELALPLVKVGGKLILWRGQNAVEELQEARSAIKRLGGLLSTHNSVFPYTLSGHDLTYHIVVVSKTKPTPAQFPRRVGLPKQKPL